MLSSNQPNAKIARYFRTFAVASSVVIILISSLVLIGWIFDIEVFKSILPSFITMKANTAIGFLLSAICLILIASGKEKSPAVLFLSLFILLIAGLSLSEYIFGIDFGIDELLFKDTITDANGHPGRMAFPTASIFVLISVSMLLIRTKMSVHTQHLYQAFLLISFVVGFISSLGYLFGTAFLSWVGTFGSLAIHTSISFLLLTTGLLASRPMDGFVRILVADTMGGLMLRRFLPACMFVPLVLGYCKLWGEKQGFYGKEFGVALFASLIMVIFTILTWVNALSLNKVDQERKRLKDLEEYLRQLLESAPDAMVVVNSHGQMVLVNSQAESLFGYKRLEMLERPVEMLIPEALRHRHVEYRKGYMKEIVRRNMGTGLDLWGSHKNGSLIPIEIALSPFYTDEGSMVIAAIRDMTQQRKVQEAVKRLNQELKEHADQLESANKELEAFSYSVSHDLRAPLRAINGFSKILNEEYAANLDSEGKRLLTVVIDNVTKMGELIDGLLDFSRMGRHEMRLSKIDVEALVKSIAEELERANPDGNIQFTFGALPMATGDPILMRQVWINLMSNAVKYSRHKPQPTIEISAKQVDQELIYQITDNGAGFDMKYIAKLFGVFQRLHEQSEFEGTGVGLAIVQRIVSRHGGRVWAESQIGEGATFYFALPATPQTTL